MKAYIRSSACISAQNTFNNPEFLTHPVEYTGTRLKTVEPDYRAFVDQKSLRRMSHVIRMGVATGMQCLRDAKVETPGAVITGSAFGCMEDTISFLTRLVEMNEEMLPPTPFIQSTHNTVAAQIALMLKCHNYNSTFVHKGISFESALLDSMMLLNEGEANDILVGGIDEMVDASFKVLTRLGLYKRRPISNLELYNSPTKGTVGGEGAAFFVLNDKVSPDNLAELTDVRTFYGATKSTDVEGRITGFLNDNDLDISHINLVITGRNGDVRNDMIYDQLKLSLFKNTALANYKHLCGEYPTSSAFALWLASNILSKGMVPGAVIETPLSSLPKKILIYNHYQNTYHSMMLVSACN